MGMTEAAARLLALAFLKANPATTAEQLAGALSRAGVSAADLARADLLLKAAT